MFCVDAFFTASPDFALDSRGPSASEALETESADEAYSMSESESVSDGDGDGDDIVTAGLT